ncbi:MAG TPA: hypothetical protein VFD63_21010, partial [Pyrinomonadaceae bacterium]|nr:hypothetical protein [Pyrinomonadaceae bacterium]
FIYCVTFPLDHSRSRTTKCVNTGWFAVRVREHEPGLRIAAFLAPLVQPTETFRKNPVGRELPPSTRILFYLVVLLIPAAGCVSDLISVRVSEQSPFLS